ncbi:Cas8a1 family CRISPR/Cas system-associated protein [Candidatus Chrysopegis kryptomonas]|uniref:CRISPR-associated protein Cst1 n=1 Tax=Candidatus Chryseopegocella kryptomonas TaxID=1633643 RepID=A0A0P1NYG3_9BACT|nr:Cas8a1 family CRISPR/Cas system-associated protein [Candidatus Chrysopegis kryptomonas]CUT04172.1 CRISPR-associated protein Cst1 [Candidatus Chrysopegis kryptomonas]
MEFIPSNWLYNAGVIGFLRVLESAGENKVNVENFLKEDGGVEIDDFDKKFLKEVKKVDNYEIPKLAYYYLIFNFNEIVNGEASSDDEKIKKVWGKLFNTYYRGFFNANTNYLFQHSKRSPALIQQFSDFVRNMTNSNKNSSIKCSFCLKSDYNFFYKNKFTSEHNKILGASIGEVPNTFWNLDKKNSLSICDFCSYILLHYHLGIIKLSNNSEIFINAPSFKIMWHLNNHARTLYEKQRAKEVKEILGMSLIEMTSRLQLQLSKWTKMNIEVIVKYKVKVNEKWEDKIDFFSLPYEVVDVLSDREVASLLNKIGEFKILNMVLDGKFNEILKFGERVFRIAIKPRNEWGKQERDFINENIKLERNNSNLISFSQNIFKLYALINDKIKKEVLIWT